MTEASSRGTSDLWVPMLLVLLACRPTPDPLEAIQPGQLAPDVADSEPPDTDTPVVETGDTGEAPCEVEGPWTSEAVVSPSPGVVLTVSPWIPVMLQMQETKNQKGAGKGGVGTQWDEVRTWLDCVENTDPLGMVRERLGSLEGGGNDYLAWLDLTALEPGAHEMIFQLTDTETGEELWQASSFTLERPPHRLTVHVTDGAGDPVNAKILLLKDGKAFDLASPDMENVDLKGRDVDIHHFLAQQGLGIVDLEPGDYEIIAARGPLHTVNRVGIHLAGDVEITLAVADAFDLGGYERGDFHVHTGVSYDSFLPDRVRVLSLAASGIDLAAITDHVVIDDLEEELDLVLGAGRTLTTIPGFEATLQTLDLDKVYASVGHLVAFPLDPAAAVPEKTPSLAALLDTYRDEQAALNPSKDGILQINHPRGMQTKPEQSLQEIHDLFNSLGFDPTVPPGIGDNAWMTETSPRGTEALDFDTLEVLNRGSWLAYKLVRDDWFQLLEWGRPITATGNSDTHAMTTEWAGFPTNLAPCAGAGSPDVKCWIDALRNGSVRVTTGPLVDLVVKEGDVVAAPGELFAPTATVEPPSVKAEVRVRAADWVPVQEVRLVVGGELVAAVVVDPKIRLLDGTLDITYVFDVPLRGHDNWVVAEAGWPLALDYPADTTVLGTYHDVVPEFLPIAFTNPVWIDENKDGLWAP